jgi:hypothetical protein
MPPDDGGGETAADDGGTAANGGGTVANGGGTVANGGGTAANDGGTAADVVGAGASVGVSVRVGSGSDENDGSVGGGPSGLIVVHASAPPIATVAATAVSFNAASRRRCALMGSRKSTGDASRASSMDP